MPTPAAPPQAAPLLGAALASPWALVAIVGLVALALLSDDEPRAESPPAVPNNPPENGANPPEKPEEKPQ